MGFLHIHIVFITIYLFIVTHYVHDESIKCIMYTCTVLHVTGPAKIDHVSANYTNLYFANIFCLECSILFL